MVNIDKFLLLERRLDTIIRFGAKTRIKNETVAEHSFHTALYAMILADMEENFGNRVNKEKLLKTALLHDLEECQTGDIIYNFKHGDEKLSKQISKFSLKFFERIMKNLPEKMSKEYIDLWKNSKDLNTIEGRIMEAADKLEGLLYSNQELSLGNSSFKDVIDVYIKQLKSLKLKSVDIVLEKIKV